MTKERFFFLNVRASSGNILSRKGPMMSLALRVLTGVFATAIAIAPSLAAEAPKVIEPVATDGAKTAKSGKPLLVDQVADYSEEHPVVVIGISKGQKESLLTGEQIGAKLSEVLMKVHGIPSKYIVEPGGDYTAVIFAVKGHMYGPYGLKESLGGLATAGSAYNARVLPRAAVAPAGAQGLAARPEPTQR